MTRNARTLLNDKQLAEYALLAGLVDYGLLIPSGVAGVFGHSAAYDAVVAAFNRVLDEATRDDGATNISFPPLLPRSRLARCGYLESFPHLSGVVFGFDTNDRTHAELRDRLARDEAYADLAGISDLALVSATCQPLYPACSGRLPEGGKLFDLSSYCFRHEPSADPARQQIFRMREHVRLGDASEVQSWREAWLARARELMIGLGLEVEQVLANDPFLGRGGRMLAENQRQEELKFELVTPITSDLEPTAIVSFNYHEQHFSHLYDIHTRRGALAHSACVGFGLERIAIALFRTHGFDPRQWPDSVRQRLNLGDEIAAVPRGGRL